MVRLEGGWYEQGWLDWREAGTRRMVRLEEGWYEKGWLDWREADGG